MYILVIQTRRPWWYTFSHWFAGSGYWRESTSRDSCSDKMAGVNLSLTTVSEAEILQCENNAVPQNTKFKNFQKICINIS